MGKQQSKKRKGGKVMAAKDYKLCVSGIMGTVFISKVSKTNTCLMLNDRRVVPEAELIDVILDWAKSKLKGDENVINITEQDKVVAQIKLLDIAESVEKEHEQTPQICYKTNEPCKHDCKGLCKESC